MRGGKVKIRARVKELNSKTLIITEIPFGTTTGSLIDSIIAANDKGKIKVKKVEDNTSENVEILIHLQPGISPDKTIDALYAFTNCELSISPNACIIEDKKPRFVGVSEILKISTQQTLQLLKRELEIELKELEEKWHFSSLEKLFIKEEMYIDFKKYSNKETLYEYLYDRFKPHRKKLIRDITDEDFQRLTQIPMIRITRFDSIKAEDFMKELDAKIEVVKNHLLNLVDYAVEYFKNLKKKYGAGRERKTETKELETIVATEVIMANEKLYVNRAEGFAGKSLKKDEFVSDCSDLDDFIAFTKDGKMKVFKVSDKVFIGKDIIYIAIFKKNDERTTYNMIYSDGPKGVTFIKRFNVTGITREKEYDLTKGTANSAVHWFTINPNGEAEKVQVILKPVPGLRKFELDIDFAEIPVKGRASTGNIVTKYAIKKVLLKTKGASTLAAEDYWFNDTVHRLNKDSKGTYLGKFAGDDKILTVTSKGFYKLYTYDVLNHFDDDIILIEKYYPEQVLSCIYYDGESKSYITKRFIPENTSTKTLIITENDNSRMELITSQILPIVDIKFNKEKDKVIADEALNLVEFAPMVNMKAKPVWVFGVHRRSELKRHYLLGAVGAVGSSVGYLSGRIAPVREAGWGYEAISPGEMTRRPESDHYGLRWPGDGSVGLGLDGRQAFLTLGHMAPLRQAIGPYQVDIEVRIGVLPSQGSATFSLAFGHVDDRYYEHRQGELDGYHALLRMDGSLEIWSHSAGMVDGRRLGAGVPGPTPKVGTWVPLRLTVTPRALTWSRLDTGAVIVVEDDRFRGDYIHVGLAATDGRILLRRLGIT